MRRLIERAFASRVVLALLALACAVRLITVLVAIESEYNPYRKLQGDPTRYSALAVSVLPAQNQSDRHNDLSHHRSSGMAFN